MICQVVNKYLKFQDTKNSISVADQVPNDPELDIWTLKMLIYQNSEKTNSGTKKVSLPCYDVLSECSLNWQ